MLAAAGGRRRVGGDGDGEDGKRKVQRKVGAGGIWWRRKVHGGGAFPIICGARACNYHKRWGYRMEVRYGPTVTLPLAPCRRKEDRPSVS